jgi:hypothetical protein
MRSQSLQLKFLLSTLLSLGLALNAVPTAQASKSMSKERNSKPETAPAEGSDGHEKGGRTNNPGADDANDATKRGSPAGKPLQYNPAPGPVMGSERGGGPNDSAEIIDLFKDLTRSLKDFPTITVKGRIKGKYVEKELRTKIFDDVVNDEKFEVAPVSPAELQKGSGQIETENYETGRKEWADFRSVIGGFKTEYSSQSWRQALPWTRQQMLTHELCVLAAIPDPNFKTSNILLSWLFQNMGHGLKSAGATFETNSTTVSISLIQTNPASLLGNLKDRLRRNQSQDSAISREIRQSSTKDSTRLDQVYRQDQDIITYKTDALLFKLEPFEETMGIKDAIRLSIEINRDDLQSMEISKSIGSYDKISFRGASALSLVRMLTTLGEKKNPYSNPDDPSNAGEIIQITQGLSSTTLGFKYQVACIDLKSGPKKGLTCSMTFSN